MLLIALCRLLVTWLPLVATLWGMVLVANWYEWRRYWCMAWEASLAPALGTARQWTVIERRGEETVRRVRCQELVIRRYSR